MAIRTYVVLTPVEHDHVRVEEGGSIVLSDEQAAPLLALNAIEPKNGKKAAEASAQEDQASA